MVTVLRINHHLHKETPARRLGLTVKMLYRLLGAGKAGEAAESVSREGGRFDLKRRFRRKRRRVLDKVHLLLVCFILIF